jgi:metallophosphoesterase (TIGR00282 family)
MFRLLFIGDVVGEAGCAAIKALVPALRQELRLDAVVANAENSATEGRGITADSGSALLEAVDFLTLGDHAFDVEGSAEFLDRESRVVRPANVAENLPGRGWGTFQARGVRIGVANVQGRVFMQQTPRSPFDAADEAIADLESSGAVLVLVDVHAEATSEKQAMGYHLAARAQAVVGTHTHVPTADARILSGDTAYVTDVGMTGGTDSVIGFSKEDFVNFFLGREPSRIEVAEGPVGLNAVLIEMEVEGRQALGIEYVSREWRRA